MLVVVVKALHADSKSIESSCVSGLHVLTNDGEDGKGLISVHALAYDLAKELSAWDARNTHGGGPQTSVRLVVIPSKSNATSDNSSPNLLEQAMIHLKDGSDITPKRYRCHVVMPIASMLPLFVRHLLLTLSVFQFDFVESSVAYVHQLLCSSSDAPLDVHAIW